MYRKEDFFQAIGHISVLFATLDLFVTLAFLHLVGVWKTSLPAPFNDYTTLGQKLRLLENLKPNEVVNPGLLATLQSQLPWIIDIAKERNRYIHDMWIFKPDLISQGRIQRARLEAGGLKNGSLSEPEEMTLDDLYKFAKEVGEAQKVFANALQVLDPNNVYFQD